MRIFIIDPRMCGIPFYTNSLNYFVKRIIFDIMINADTN